MTGNLRKKRKGEGRYYLRERCGGNQIKLYHTLENGTEEGEKLHSQH